MSEFYHRYFAPQSVARENRMFSPEHLILSGLTLLFIIFVLVRTVRKTPSQADKTLRALAWLMLGLEIFRISWRTAYFGFDLRHIRFDWCNQICLILPIVILTRAKKIYQALFPLAILGGVGVLIYPLWVFYDYAGFHLLAAQSLFSHGLMVLIPLLLPLADPAFLPDIKKIWQPFLGTICIILIAITMSYLLDENYFLAKGANGLPLIQDIAYPWYFIPVISAMGIGCAATVSISASIYKRKKFFF